VLGEGVATSGLCGEQANLISQYWEIHRQFDRSIGRSIANLIAVLGELYLKVICRIPQLWYFCGFHASFTVVRIFSGQILSLFVLKSTYVDVDTLPKTRVFFGGIVGCSVGQTSEKSHNLLKVTRAFYFGGKTSLNFDSCQT
jgi:hypothetical protein